MGTIKTPSPVKLVMGLLAATDMLMDEAVKLLAASYGGIDLQSGRIPFTFTDYYAAEMGTELRRQWISFEHLQQPDALAAIKVATNRLEENFFGSGRRRVNIDPGYLTQANLILASTKDFSHRIYLGQGIYGEVTLIYKGKGFTALPWTYPDYQSPAALSFLEAARTAYRAQLKSL